MHYGLVDGALNSCQNVNRLTDENPACMRPDLSACLDYGALLVGETLQSCPFESSDMGDGAQSR